MLKPKMLYGGPEGQLLERVVAEKHSVKFENIKTHFTSCKNTFRHVRKSQCETTSAFG